MIFTVKNRDGRARRGELSTEHGIVETPAFMPVGTQGAVKTLTPQQLEDCGASVMLSNLYHLSLRPGVERISRLGGIHEFTGWRRPILTDSGGFQVFSLSGLRDVDDDGVSFRNHLDGSPMRLTPESVMDAEAALGVDIAMVLDECTPWPVEKEVAAASWLRTLNWARRSRERWSGSGGVFGIVQGSVYEDLRLQSVEDLIPLDFDGYAVGGVSVGEPGPDRRNVVEWCGPALPDGKPRYLMGVGYPEDILHGVRNGIDLFDCVLPARNARHGTLFTRRGIVKIKHAEFADDPRPVDESCCCPTCERFSRAAVHHLLRQEPQTGRTLTTLHNIRFYLDFMAEIREAIAANTLADFSFIESE